MQVVLVMFRADGERKSFSITRDVTVMGRREDCDFRIPLGDISRKHCRLIKEDEALKIEDLGSSNGTYINGKRIHEAELQPGEAVAQEQEEEVALEAEGGSEDAVQLDDEEQPAETTLDKDGDFDPMSVLEGNVDSDIMPALPDSAIREDIMLDMSDSRQQREG